MLEEITDTLLDEMWPLAVGMVCISSFPLSCCPPPISPLFKKISRICPGNLVSKPQTQWLPSLHTNVGPSSAPSQPLTCDSRKTPVGLSLFWGPPARGDMYMGPFLLPREARPLTCPPRPTSLCLLLSWPWVWKGFLEGLGSAAVLKLWTLVLFILFDGCSVQLGSVRPACFPVVPPQTQVLKQMTR